MRKEGRPYQDPVDITRKVATAQLDATNGPTRSPKRQLAHDANASPHRKQTHAQKHHE
jgi:hypothetical protein